MPSAAQTTLIVRHLPKSEPSRFQLTRLSDNKTTDPVEVPSPFLFPVEGRSGSNLMHEMRWYLEDFLDYPFPPETDRADRVREALRKWGEKAFDGLMASRSSGRMFDTATREDYSDLHLRISSDDAQVLAWPWEALFDQEIGAFLAHTCRIERKLDGIRDPRPLPQGLPKDRVNILLVVARPYEQDVRFRSIARPLVELIEKERLPAQVDLLRPPTFDQLREHLRRRPGYYHILHFDGHGSYASDSRHRYGGNHAEGKLVFEDRDGTESLVSAQQLNTLLRDYAVPAVVLNACQSAMLDERARDPFASVATALLRSGVRSVVAMAYSLYVSGGKEFLPQFYRRLFEAGSVAEATRAGRREMLAHPLRVCARGEFQLDDWILPVLYQQEPLDFSFAAEAKRSFSAPESKLPEIAQEQSAYGFIGRDGPLPELERAMHRPPPAILIEGLGGVGKTTLARGFLAWLEATNGLGERAFWFNFQEIRSAEYVFNRLGEALFGPQFGALAIDQKIEGLAKVFREKRFVIVWDNFEVAKGVPNTPVTANLSAEDRGLLASFLDKLRGGASKVIITSRSPERWLRADQCFRLPLGGLDGEERWEYCAAVLRDLGKPIDWSDKDLVELMTLLGGHPLAMRVILPRLEKLSAAQVLAALQSNLDAFDLGDDQQQTKLFATLRFVEQSLPEELQELLVPLAMHEGFLDVDYLEYMSKSVDAKWSRAEIDRLIGALVAAGLLWQVRQVIYRMHPLLTSFLRATRLEGSSPEGCESWARAFAEVMASVADAFTPKELHEQRTLFHVHGVNFRYALREAERLGMKKHVAALTQSLATYALNTRNFAEAAKLYEGLANSEKASGNDEGEAVSYHQLGMIAAEQRDFAAAEQWYRKSLAIKEKQWDEHDAAGTYHQLGMNAQEQRDLAAAEQWYRKALAISEKQGHEHGAARTYHQLGRIAQEQRDFAVAEQWYRKSLAIKEKQGNEHGAAITYHQLGMIAQEQRDFAAAEQWYRKSLAISEKQGNEHGAAITYHQLGMIAQEQRDFAAAEQWYRKSLGIAEKQGNEHGAAITYHQLGRIAEEQRDFAAAEQWYRKSLAIEEKHGDEHGAAGTYHQLGMIAEEQHDFAAAEQWYRKSLAISEEQGNEHVAAGTYHQLGTIALRQRDFAAAEQWYRKSLAIRAKQGDEHEAASTYHQLGINAQEQGDFGAAEQWYRKSLAIKEKQGDEHQAASIYAQFGLLARAKGNFEESGRRFIRAHSAFAHANDSHRASWALQDFLVTHRSAEPDEQAKLLAMWDQAGLGPLPESTEGLDRG